LLAATALHHNLVLVTRNLKDMAGPVSAGHESVCRTSLISMPLGRGLGHSDVKKPCYAPMPAPGLVSIRKLKAVPIKAGGLKLIKAAGVEMAKRTCF
jgi:hypothetical protein